jgi:hypothetical protein
MQKITPFLGGDATEEATFYASIFPTCAYARRSTSESPSGPPAGQDGGVTSLLELRHRRLGFGLFTRLGRSSRAA